MQCAAASAACLHNGTDTPTCTQGAPTGLIVQSKGGDPTPASPGPLSCCSAAPERPPRSWSRRKRKRAGDGRGTVQHSGEWTGQASRQTDGWLGGRRAPSVDGRLTTHSRMRHTDLVISASPSLCLQGGKGAQALIAIITEPRNTNAIAARTSSSCSLGRLTDDGDGDGGARAVLHQ